MSIRNASDGDWLRNFEHFLYFVMYASYLEARKGGKRSTFDEHKFEIYDFENLLGICRSIRDGSYAPSRGTAHIIFNPVMREIFAAAFRDRVVHHFIYTFVYEWWDRHFITDSYSCREGKGTWYGIKRLQHHMRSVSYNRTKEVFVITMDVRGYFMSLNRKYLYERAKWGLDEQFGDDKGAIYELLKFAFWKIITDDPVKGVKKKGWPQDWVGLPDSKSLLKQKSGIGIVIGNLTSQLLSNMYLDQLDRYVKFTLGYKHYGRYVDDFYIVITKEQLPKALADVELIRRFLERIGLTLHPYKQYKQPAKRGVAFLGAVVYMDAIHPGKRLRKNIAKAFRDCANGKVDVETMISYVGHVKHMKHHKFLGDICESTGLKRDYWKQFDKDEKNGWDAEGARATRYRGRT